MIEMRWIWKDVTPPKPEQEQMYDTVLSSGDGVTWGPQRVKSFNVLAMYDTSRRYEKVLQYRTRDGESWSEWQEVPVANPEVLSGGHAVRMP